MPFRVTHLLTGMSHGADVMLRPVGALPRGTEVALRARTTWLGQAGLGAVVTRGAELAHLS